MENRFHGAGITPQRNGLRSSEGGLTQIILSHAKAQRTRNISFRIKGVDIWKMKAEWLMERGGMVLMITHPNYLCHPKLVRRLRRFSQSRKGKSGYDGWLGEDDGDIQEVRENGIDCGGEVVWEFAGAVCGFFELV